MGVLSFILFNPTKSRIGCENENRHFTYWIVCSDSELILSNENCGFLLSCQDLTPITPFFQFWLYLSSSAKKMIIEAPA